MKQYLSLVEEVLANGTKKEDRTGTGTISIFGMQRKYDLRDGFPLLTTKKVLFTGILRELLWFLKGSTNINDDLTQHTPIWDAWADENGELGPIYGYQWRNWDGKGIDQIQNAIDMIKTNPDSRRIIVNAWNVADVPRMALPPCHLLFQFYVVDGRLDCQLYQRSADIALGVPFNIASYAALMHMVAQECNLQPGIFTHTLGDAHIYLNHVEGLQEQLTRTPKALPQLKLANKPFWDLAFEDFEITDYEHDPFIKFKVAV
ncbi:thymidylate synthase [Candidatus Peregrinibacteria bacterium CG11_big_fil_rev_8_21_14_0_20_41_10]|nr:MAG: thymidylate synthase [Candidatus Peregrinibacteria bacterium CG11_big_fil_rev_8_21_14_0_20_41_10]PIZ77763.1 MAG: thymidylate synthase [Candidatus Peregrinibacteria bacterium CG_4_10_14_0_2_um_filter_41_8]PJC37542.1 MAG: thymidylate synthase [Candidatus Peregrinibacteria bacterium CG_4_9_14_0_2_um_filter_41_14]